jgi:hypothetical protein
MANSFIAISNPSLQQKEESRTKMRFFNGIIENK